MLKKLDQYIILKYLKTFSFAVLIFTIVAVVVNFSEMVQKYIDNKVPWNEVFFDFYLWFIPFINAQLIPLYALISVIFFTSRMAENSEILSMLNAGMSFRRIAQPFMIAATIITILSLLLNHWIVPYGNQHRLVFEREKLKLGKDVGRNSEVHLFISPTDKIYVRHYSKTDSLARDLRIERYDGQRLIMMINASRAKWNGKDSTWRLSNFTRRTFDGVEETFYTQPKSDIDTAFHLFPTDFVHYVTEKDQLPTWDLNAQIERVKQRGIGNTLNFEIEKAKRTAEPISVLILTLIGLSISGRKTRGGMGINLVVGLSLGLVFVFLSRFSHTLANSNAMPPLLGVWTPNLLFIGIAIYFLSKAQR